MFINHVHIHVAIFFSVNFKNSITSIRFIWGERENAADFFFSSFLIYANETKRLPFYSTSKINLKNFSYFTFPADVCGPSGGLWCCACECCDCIFAVAVRLYRSFLFLRLLLVGGLDGGVDSVVFLWRSSSFPFHSWTQRTFRFETFRLIRSFFHLHSLSFNVIHLRAVIRAHHHLIFELFFARVHSRLGTLLYSGVCVFSLKENLNNF